MVMCDDPRTPYYVEEPCKPLLEGDVVEIPFLLAGWQASVLETVAHQRGVTVGAVVRGLVHDFLNLTAVEEP